MNVDIIKKELCLRLSEYRYLHSLRVADEASKLALVYQYDVNKAYLAGLVHDIAKEFSDEENRRLVLKYGLPLTILEDDYHKILHSDIGALYVKEVFHFDDEICHAIKSHTIGDIPMNLLDKIIYVADKIEPGKKYDGIDEERKLAYQDIHEATILCMENNHLTLKKEKKKILAKSKEVLTYLKNEKR